MEMAKQITSALQIATRDIYNEEEQKRKGYYRPRYYYYSSRVTFKEVVFSVMEEAISNGTGGGQYPISARNLYYQIRPLIQGKAKEDFGQVKGELEYSYFSQTLLTQYQEENGPIAGLYYDPRGVLYEPHDGETINLGTREVDSYEFPLWLYNKILYIEKKGLWPIIEIAKIAERYDMAIVAAEGYATTAARTLFENAEKGQKYELYVLHDADPDGYNIARTLQEETARMPGYRVNVIDIGLTVQDGLDLGILPEPFWRRKRLPRWLALNAVESEFFGNPGQCQRIELNALSAPQLVKYIEDKLAEAGASGKVIPPEDKLAEFSEEFYKEGIDYWVDEEIAKILSVDDIKKTISEEFRDRFPLEDAHEWIEGAFEEDDAQAWRTALKNVLSELIDNEEEDMKKALQKQIHLKPKR